MKLFISYSRDDKAWVYELWRQVRDELYHDAWIDRRIVPASDWWHSILENIEQADCFVYVMSPKAVESIYCTAELDYALALNKPVLPIMLKRCDFPESLRRRRVQYETLTDEMSMDRVLLKMTMGLNRVQMALREGKYAPNEVPRPDVPSLKKDPEHIFEVFALAEEAAAEGNVTLAQQFFGQVIAADPDGLGMAAKERLDEIMIERDRATAYAHVKRMAENPALIKGARALWGAFVRQYPGYDPDGLAGTLGAKPQSTAPPVVEPDPPQTEKPAQIQVTQADTQKRVPTKSGEISAADLTRLTLEILPEPFAWLDIPGGRVTIEDHGEFDVEPFMMAKYPVTNAQFARFIQAGGYRDERWWGDGLWDIREKRGWTEPEYWQRSKWNGADYPVVGVSWYEAIAFTRWLNHTVGTRNGASGNITLPTEMQWQRAAQGDDGRVWPWSNTFDKSRANTLESGIVKTTPVTQYEGKGGSPYGVVDMSGNVWDWCLNEYDSPKQYGINKSNSPRRVLRGGSWNFNLYAARAAYRRNSLPGDRNSSLGFRLVRAAG